MHRRRKDNSVLHGTLHNTSQCIQMYCVHLFVCLQLLNISVWSTGRYAFQLWKPLGQVFSETVKKMPTAVSTCNTCASVLLNFRSHFCLFEGGFFSSIWYKPVLGNLIHQWQSLFELWHADVAQVVVWSSKLENKHGVFPLTSSYLDLLTLII